MTGLLIILNKRQTTTETKKNYPPKHACLVIQLQAVPVVILHCICH